MPREAGRGKTEPCPRRAQGWGQKQSPTFRQPSLRARCRLIHQTGQVKEACLVPGALEAKQHLLTLSQRRKTPSHLSVPGPQDGPRLLLYIVQDHRALTTCLSLPCRCECGGQARPGGARGLCTEPELPPPSFSWVHGQLHLCMVLEWPAAAHASSAHSCLQPCGPCPGWTVLLPGRAALWCLCLCSCHAPSAL